MHEKLGPAQDTGSFQVVQSLKCLNWIKVSASKREHGDLSPVGFIADLFILESPGCESSPEIETAYVNLKSYISRFLFT